MSIDDANKSITGGVCSYHGPFLHKNCTECAREHATQPPDTEAELAERIIEVTIKLDNSPHSITRPDFERIWLMGYRAAGGTVHPDEASHPISLAQYASGCELMHEQLAELRQDLQSNEHARAQLQAQLDSRYVDPTINALLQRVIDGDPGLALNGAERKCLERWLQRSLTPSRAIAVARAALEQARADFDAIIRMLGQDPYDDALNAGLRCTLAINTLDEAAKR